MTTTQSNTNTQPKDQPLQLILEYLHSKPGISVSTTQNEYLFNCVTLTSHHLFTRILTSPKNPNEKVLVDLLTPSIQLGTHFPYNWESHLRKALAYNLAQHHRLDYKEQTGLYLGTISLDELQGYYNNQTQIHLGKKPKNEHTFLAQELFSNEQRQDIIDNLYNTATAYLNLIETDKFQKIKTYLNSQNIPQGDIQSKSLQEFARHVTLSEFFLSYPYTERKNYLTAEQKRDITSRPIELDDDDCF